MPSLMLQGMPCNYPITIPMAKAVLMSRHALVSKGSLLDNTSIRLQTFHTRTRGITMEATDSLLVKILHFLLLEIMVNLSN